MSSQPATFDRRSARLSRILPTISISPAMLDASLKRPVDGRTRRSSIVAGFLPLPSISASPICTPTTSTSSRDFVFGGGSDHSEWSSSESYTTAPTSASPTSRASPRWISSPSTTPPKLFKRSVTCISHLQAPPSAPPSSFPAFMFPHASDHLIHRRNSVPAMSPRPGPSSHLYPSISRRKRPKHPDSLTDHPSHFFSPARRFSDVSVAMDSSRRSPSSMTVKPTIDGRKTKDNIRRYHALQELLSTEVSYLEDLKVLVLIYLRQLPTLTLKRSSSASSTFVRNSSLSALSRASSSVHLSHSTPKEPVRPIFKNSEIDALTRNAEEVLEFHSHFVQELRTALGPFGFRVEAPSRSSDDPHDNPSTNLENLDAGIALVSSKYATEASRFVTYEQFCAGHPEAMDILRRTQYAHPTEWEEFEKKCGISAYEMLNGHSSSSSSEENHSPAPLTESRTKCRRNSATSIDSAVRYVRSRSNSLAAHRDLEARNRSRLMFMDYLIKPVQRICKYPLLLDQLKSSKIHLVDPAMRASRRSDVVTESALQAMRHVASSVDEARRLQDVAVRSALIASRIAYPPVMPSSSHPVLQTLTASFVSSLGVCHLAGSLDVIHQQPPSKPSTGVTNVHVKYLGAFLYRGGYLILARVKGKIYEPRHWFRLCDSKILDVDESQAWLPCSFRLSYNGHEFELAAACQREKEVWLTAIRESLSYPMSGWINVPINSTYLDSKGEMVPSRLDGPFEALPALNSSPDVTPSRPAGEQLAFAETALNALINNSEPSSRKSSNAATPQTPGPSRQSSTGSLRYSSSQYETFIIRRNLPSSRTQVDAALSDVLSDACLFARANSKEEELFHAPTVSRQGSPIRTSPTKSSNSGLTMAKNRLRRHESVLVPRKKSHAQMSDYFETGRASRAKSLSLRSRPQFLSLITHSQDLTDPLSTLLTPSSFSACSDPSSTMCSPSLEHRSSITDAPRSEPDYHGTRPSSFAGSFRSIFNSRPPSPPLHPLPAPTAPSPLEQKAPSGNVFKRWVRSSTFLRTHRRTLSDGTALGDPTGLPELAALSLTS
ncbi:hypothetical protein D9757_002644 [Collybiopsis confluens]|uniref:DH domain-containing protein n=1 Tax=Collybiopsis confluens TaxID=2823264 RepID=A0A8H5ME53_9AGAR|nr:hypothetical protein D9757_002644 [Collybiopsis confluens]